MKKYKKIVIVLLSLILLVSCAPSANELVKTANADGNLAGFWKGIWHGGTLLFTFIGSLFNSDINIYEAHNVGPLYNLGYLLGVSMFFSGSGGGVCKSSRRRRKNN